MAFFEVCLKARLEAGSVPGKGARWHNALSVVAFFSRLGALALFSQYDPIGCGHSFCRSHVVDLAQHNLGSGGMKCAMCRKEKNIADFNQIAVQTDLWKKIRNSHFHRSGRRSTAASRSVTPLQDRFNKLFFMSCDF